MTRIESDFMEWHGEQDVDDGVDAGELDIWSNPGSEPEEVPVHGYEFRKISRRICLIQRKQGSEGTGFLVGPDLMLTAAHNLLGTAGIFADPADVTILFDHFLWNRKTRTMAFGDQCGLRYIPFKRQPDVLASSIRTDPFCQKARKDNGLDYVLVRLDRPIGLSFLPFSYRMRGWNDCTTDDAAAAGEVLVVQHPLGGLLKFAKGMIPPQAREPFFYYTTRTLSGASGSPIYDKRQKLVGLHIGERVERKRVRHLGVSFKKIFADLKKQGVKLPRFPVSKSVMDSLFGTSAIQELRKEGEDWRGDRLWDDWLRKRS